MRLLTVAAAAAALSACANVYTSRNLAAVDADTNGLTYALPTTWLQISGEAPKKGQGGMVVKVASLTLPDAGHLYSLEHVTSGFARDQITIEVGKDQLLKSVHTTTEDVTDQIIVSLAKTVSGLAAFSIPHIAPPPPDRAPAALPPCNPPPAPPWKVIFDPFTPETWPVWLNEGCLALTPIGETGKIATAETRQAESCERGICHRAPIPHRVAIDLGEAGMHHFVGGFLNNAPILSIDVDRTWFVEKKMDLEFSSGVLIKVVIDRPSPMLALASLPLDVAKAILSAPAEIFRLRVDYSNRYAAERAAHAKALQAERDYRALLRQIAREEAERRAVESSSSSEDGE